ncbi:hypothetical protein RYX36_016939, partial [Vicia faba]
LPKRDNNITAEVVKSLYISKGARRVFFRTLILTGSLFKMDFDACYVGFVEE